MKPVRSCASRRSPRQAIREPAENPGYFSSPMIPARSRASISFASAALSEVSASRGTPSARTAARSEQRDHRPARRGEAGQLELARFVDLVDGDQVGRLAEGRLERRAEAAAGAGIELDLDDPGQRREGAVLEQHDVLRDVALADL